MIVKERLDFIDLAKGFGMLMVVYLHTTINYPSAENVYSGSHWDCFVHSMFMPIFFILSGVFFSAKQPFFLWLKKKAKRMVLPFVIFYTLTYLLNVVLVSFFHVTLKSGFSYWDVFAVFVKDVYPNSAIWFLLALFWSSIIMYWIIRIADKLNLQILMVVTSFAIGYMLEVTKTNIPLYVDTAFSAVPFLYLGYLFKRFDMIHKLYAQNTILIAGVSFACFLFDWFWGASASMVNNTGNSFLFFLSGTCGSLAVIGLAFILNKLPLVSYIGRYSMLVLCTHMYLTNVFARLMMKLDINFYVNSIIAALLVLLCYYVIVPLAKRSKMLECVL